MYAQPSRACCCSASIFQKCHHLQRQQHCDRHPAASLQTQSHCSCRQTAPRAGCCNPVLVAPHARPACRICNPSECGPDTLRALVKNSKTQGCWLPAAYCPMLRPCDTCFRRAKSKHKCHPSCVSVRCTRMAGDVRAWSWRLPAFNLDSTQELP